MLEKANPLAEEISDFLEGAGDRRIRAEVYGIKHGKPIPATSQKTGKYRVKLTYGNKTRHENLEKVLEEVDLENINLELEQRFPNQKLSVEVIDNYQDIMDNFYEDLTGRKRNWVPLYGMSYFHNQKDKSIITREFLDDTGREEERQELLKKYLKGTAATISAHLGATAFTGWRALEGDLEGTMIGLGGIFITWNYGELIDGIYLNRILEDPKYEITDETISPDE